MLSENGEFVGCGIFDNDHLLASSGGRRLPAFDL